MNNILEYQKLDIELKKLKKSTINNEDQNNMNKLKNYIVDYHTKGMKLEESADKLIKDYNDLKVQYDANCDKIQKLTKKNVKDIDADNVDDVLSTINGLSSELFLLERNINIIINKIKESLKEFEITKKSIIKAKQKYSDLKEKYNQGVLALKPKIKEIEDKMTAMEKSLDPELFAKYKTIKNDKIFPVFVSLNNGHCAGCSVEIPTSRLNKLKNEKMIVCEQCHRLIYQK